MNEKLLGRFLLFLDQEGLLTKPLSYKETVQKFLDVTKTTANVVPPPKFKGFAIGEKEKNTSSE
jgi:hypothetical protein